MKVFLCLGVGALAYNLTGGLMAAINVDIAPQFFSSIAGVVASLWAIEKLAG